MSNEDISNDGIDGEISGSKIEADDMNSGTSEHVQNGIFDDDESPEDLAPSYAEVRREKRRRRKHLKQFLSDIGISDDEALEHLVKIDRLLPDVVELSSGSSLEERLNLGSKSMSSLRSALFKNSHRTMSYDAANDVDRFFRENKNVSDMISSEDDLLRSIMINERVMSAHDIRAMEHQATRSFLLQELVRRRSMAESWKYLIPKFLLPVFSGFHAAGVRSKDMQERSKLLSNIIDVLDNWSGSNVSREDIIEAMHLTEDQFFNLLSEEEDPFGALEDIDNDAINSSSSSHVKAETFEDMSERINELISETKSSVDVPDTISDEEHEKLKVELNVLSLSKQLGGVVNAEGHIVFGSEVSFVKAVVDHIDTPTASTSDEAGEDKAISVEEPEEPEDLSLIRSIGINRSFSGSAPFGSWGNAPDNVIDGAVDKRFGPMHLRKIAYSDEHAGELSAADQSRLEFNFEAYACCVINKPSYVLGKGHPLMLVPHGSLPWYGSRLGWQENRIRSIRPFENPLDTTTMLGVGDFKQFMTMFRENAQLNMNKLKSVRDDGFFSDNEKGAERLAEAAEDIARWWVFVLVGRHNMLLFDRGIGEGFFHGVHGPDFILDENNNPVFGDSYIRIQENSLVSRTPKVVAETRYRNFPRRLDF